MQCVIIYAIADDAGGLHFISKSAVLLDGGQSEAFDVEQGVAQGCSLSPILFSVFINGLFREVEEADSGVEKSIGGTLVGLLFARVDVSESKDQLQRLIDVVYAYCRKWRLRANVSKITVMLGSQWMGLGRGGAFFCLKCLSTHTWVLTLPVLVHGMSISGSNGRKKVNRLHMSCF